MKMFDFISKSITAKIILLVILVSTLPYLFSGLMMSKQITESSRIESQNKLKAVGVIKRNQILNFFLERKGDINVLAKQHDIHEYLTKMEELESNSKIALEELILTKEYLIATKNVRDYLLSYSNQYGYKDVLLITHKGDVLFSLKENSDLGTNIIHGRYKDSSLGRAVYRTKHNDGIGFSDLSFYEPNNNTPEAFVAKIIYEEDDAETIHGYVAFEIPREKLDAIMNEKTGLGLTGETYLVGEDYLMRSDSRFSKKSTTLVQEIKTKATINLLTNLTGNHDDSDGTGQVREIEDYRGSAVYSFYSYVGLEEHVGTDFDWIILAEIDKAEALASARKLITFYLFLGLLLITIVIFIAIFFSKLIANPIRQITETAKLLATGDTTEKINVTLVDEVGVLANTFTALQSSMRAIAHTAKAISSGDYSQDLVQRSDKDELSISLNEMTTTLKVSTQKQQEMLDFTQEMNIEIQQIMSAATPICAINTDFDIIRVNDTFCNLFDVDIEKTVGKKCYDVLDLAVCNSKDCLLKQILAGSKKVNINIATDLNNGKVTDCNVLGIPLRDKDGVLKGLVENISDITETLKAEREIKARGEEIERKNWVKTGQNELNDMISGDKNLRDMSKIVITYLTKYIDAKIGAIYIVSDTNANELSLTGSYAFTSRKNLSNKIKIGEGLVGQAALEKEIITLLQVPEDYIKINSSLGDIAPKNILVAPFIFEGVVLGVAEIGSINEFTSIQLEFINTVMDNIAIAVNSSISRTKMKLLLDQTQQQSEELQAQQEELRVSNEELQQQTEELTTTSEKLKIQQEELQATNEELEEKTESLENQRSEIERQNREIILARDDLEKKAEDLTIASKYKSEFLANMSHELRTPLNSLLILSKDLSENKKGNLSPRQVEASAIIYNSGNDLLNLINEILDLSKVEAGMMSLSLQEVFIDDIIHDIKTNFTPVVNQKGVELIVEIEEGTITKIVSDYQRIGQVIKNLLSNAIKFTEKGSVSVKFMQPESSDILLSKGFTNEFWIAFSVSDTGIGIPKEKQSAIFEAFQQADGSTSRKFGGTGLGLSISRELVKLLGGEIHLESQVGVGSTFTVVIPKALYNDGSEEAIAPKVEVVKPKEIAKPIKELDIRQEAIISMDIQKRKMIEISSIRDDREEITPQDTVILAIEDDQNFATILRQFCNDQNFKFVHAGNGEEGLRLAKKYVPSAIILDIMLPGMDGWEVLDELKKNPKLSNIPVQMMSALDENIDIEKKGILGFITKPVSNKLLANFFNNVEAFKQKGSKKVLVLETENGISKELRDLFANQELELTSVSNDQEALTKITMETYDCMVIDIALSTAPGFNLLQKLHSSSNFDTPIIVYTDKKISAEEEAELTKYSSSIIVRGKRSKERLMDETALFLHKVKDSIPKEKIKKASMLKDKDAHLKGKKILVVDDDMRNVFAVSHVLEDRGMIVTSAVNGQKAIDALESDEEFDLVLMDIMMPVMDGEEATIKIRQNVKFKDLPIIVLTAKAMKGDKERFIKAGASDYLAKPLNVERLLSLLRVWLSN